jgi:hypothetical protein
MTVNLDAILIGALSGLLTAAAVDYQTFRAWHTIDEIRTFDWRTALFRWAQGAVTGAITAAGVSWMR